MTPVSWMTLLLSFSPLSSSQSSFSPFSLLGSLFSSAPSWPQTRQRPETRQSRQPPHQQLHFRPKIPTGGQGGLQGGQGGLQGGLPHKFSASQVNMYFIFILSIVYLSLLCPPIQPFRLSSSSSLFKGLSREQSLIEFIQLIQLSIFRFPKS